MLVFSESVDPFIALLMVKWAIWLFTLIMTGVVIWSYRRRF